MTTKTIKKYLRVGLLGCAFAVASMSLTSCNDWLDILPNNEQVTDDYWKSKEDVEAVLASGYYYLQQSVPTIIKWGELRGDALYSTNTADARLQNFNMTSGQQLCNWSNIYKVIGMANSVIMYAPGVNDKTYYASIRDSHLAEAYFMRAYCYLLLVKNFKEVPLVLTAYVNDRASFDLAKSKEEVIIAQIKEDIKTALETGAAKGVYEDEWATKGRATKWALYALMADACLWSEDYDQCIQYCDMILKANDTFRPAFLYNTDDWYKYIFYEGNSNESIMEINWNTTVNGTTNNFTDALFGNGTSSATLRPTMTAMEKMKAETAEVSAAMGGQTEGMLGRMLYCTYRPDGSSWADANQYYIWKYSGDDVGETRDAQDANFILYRVAEIMLMKAQALTMKGEESWPEAIQLVNTIRNRAGLPDYDMSIDQLDELTLLNEVLDQKEMELMAEGKRWYDVLWLSRVADGRYKTNAIDMIVESNRTTNKQWILSVLQEPYAWYIPIPQDDIEHNKLLVQNPYYATTK